MTAVVIGDQGDLLGCENMEVGALCFELARAGVCSQGLVDFSSIFTYDITFIT